VSDRSARNRLRHNQMALLVPHLPGQGTQTLHAAPPVVVPRAPGVSQPPLMPKSKLAVLNPDPPIAPAASKPAPPVQEERSQLPPICSGNAREPHAAPARSFRDKVAMLSVIRGGGMAQYDYTRRRPAPRPAEDIDPAPMPDEVGPELVDEPLPGAPPRPMFAHMRRGVRRPPTLLGRPLDP
jgi:hypothetical protein